MVQENFNISLGENLFIDVLLFINETHAFVVVCNAAV